MRITVHPRITLRDMLQKYGGKHFRAAIAKVLRHADMRQSHVGDRECGMGEYLLIESRDPFESDDVGYHCGLARGLVEAGNRFF
jgi:hypothetical protein